jgi:hypothetical protein
MNAIRPVTRRLTSATAVNPGRRQESVSVLPERTAVHGLASAQPAATADTSLHIERLIIRGVSLPAGSTSRLEVAFQVELQRLANTSPLSNTHLASFAMAALRLEPIRIDPAGGAEQLGRKLAQALWGGLAP